MEVLEKDLILRNYGYLKDSEIEVEMAILNEKTLCVNISAPIRKVKELIAKYGWNCIIDSSGDENLKIFTCIVREIN